MNAETSRPLRITVLGNSVPLFIAPQRATHDEGTYVQWIERLLIRSGTAVDLENYASWNELVTASTRAFDARVRSRPPDVLILNVGAAEMFPGVIPRWLHRHIHTWSRPQRRANIAYGRFLVDRVWPMLRNAQRQLFRVHDGFGYKMRPERFRRELHHLIELAVHETKPLVLAVGIGPAVGPAEYWVPGLERRSAQFNDIVKAVAESHAHNDVRFVDLAGFQREMGLAAAQPDGLHMSAEGHRRFAEVVVAEITQWMHRCHPTP